MESTPETYRRAAGEMLARLGKGEVLEVLPPRTGESTTGAVIAEQGRATRVFVAGAAIGGY